MNLDQSRLLFIAIPSSPVWTGTVVSWNAVDFSLTVTPVSGAYPDDIGNLLIAHAGTEVARIKSRDGNVLYLAETPVQFEEAADVAIYQMRLPWPRYQYIDAGVVYKDHDIAFPTPWQHSMPPTAVLRARLSGNDWAEAIFCYVGETIYLDASDSYANLDDGAPLDYAWTPGTGGAVTGSGATVTCAYSTVGFRYLKLQLTDAHDTAVARYLPVWVGAAQTIDAVTSCRARWNVKNGWTVDLELQNAVELFQYSPALLVDAETHEALFFGFVVPDSHARTFETTTQTLTLQSALAFSRFLHAYPFLVTDVRAAVTPSEWAEVYALTLARALWYLLYWHSTLPEVVNTDLGDAPVRDISGQEFTLGSLPQQVDAVLRSAFWQARGERSGGLRVNADPLFLSQATWDALSALDLSDPLLLRNSISTERAQPAVNQVRVGGVFRDYVTATFKPALAQAPSVPGSWGSPSEVNGLAPVSAEELQAWAGRYIAVENTADTYTVEPGLVVDPAVTHVVDLPEVRIAVERTEMQFNPEAMRWHTQIGGRGYGRASGAVAVPLPPPIEYPPPDLPPFLPPIWDPIPVDPILWPPQVYVTTQYGGVYYTDNFSGRDSEQQPTWVEINEGLPVYDDKIVPLWFALAPFEPNTHQYIHIRQGPETGGFPLHDGIYRRSNGAPWELVLSLADALTYAGFVPTAYKKNMYCCVNSERAGEITCAVRNQTLYVRLIRSSDYGASWSRLGTETFGSYIYTGFYPMFSIGPLIYICWSTGSASKIWRSENDGYSIYGSSSATEADGILGVSKTLPQQIYTRNHPDLVIPVWPSGDPFIFLQEGLAPVTGFGGMWISDLNPSLQRILRRTGTDDFMELYQTEDGWDSMSLVGQLPYGSAGQYFRQVLCLNEGFDQEDWMILGLRAPSSAHPHTIWVNDQNTHPNSPIGKSGIDPLGGVDSIPYLAGGSIDFFGVQYVKP